MLSRFDIFSQTHERPDISAPFNNLWCTLIHAHSSSAIKHFRTLGFILAFIFSIWISISTRWVLCIVRLIVSAEELRLRRTPVPTQHIPLLEYFFWTVDQFSASNWSFPSISTLSTSGSGELTHYSNTSPPPTKRRTQYRRTKSVNGRDPRLTLFPIPSNSFRSAVPLTTHLHI